MADFQSLELILDSNIDRANADSFQFESSSIANAGEEFPPPPRASSDEPEVGLKTTRTTPSSSAWNGSANPVSGVASLTLAMGSLFSLNLASPARTSSPRRGWVSSPPKKITADPSARRALNPSPVVGSSKVGVSMGAAPALGEAEAVARSGKTKKAASFISPFPDYQRAMDGQAGEPRNPAGLRRATMVWFRNDLRVHDNEALVNASNESVSILPVYCFDPRDYGKSSSGFDKTGPYRAKFLLECVANLRENLRERGSELVVRVGRPEEVLPRLARSVGADALYAHQEVAHEEMSAEEKVSAAMEEEGVDCKFFWGSTLFHIDDLPFKLQEMPSNYGGFREKVQGVGVRDTIAAPKQLKGLPIRGGVKAGDIPSLQDLGLNPTSAKRPEKHTAYGGALLVGGEEEALQRLKSFSAEAAGLSISKNGETTKPGDSIYGANFSCKISPWLAMGCLSPRRMFEDLKQNTKRVNPATVGKGEVGSVEGDGMNWLIFELLWRDFFRFITKKFGDGKRMNDTTPATACTGVLAAA